MRARAFIDSRDYTSRKGRTGLPTTDKRYHELGSELESTDAVVNPQVSATATLVPTGFSKPVAETLPGVVRRIAQALRPEKIVLFGSYAYGTPTPDSDVDLLVVLESDDLPVERHLAVSRLLRPRPFPVDVLVKTPADIRHARQVGDRFVEEILSRGQLLYERKT